MHCVTDADTPLDAEIAESVLVAGCRRLVDMCECAASRARCFAARAGVLAGLLESWWRPLVRVAAATNLFGARPLCGNRVTCSG
jgi:hypothetical protein